METQKIQNRFEGFTLDELHTLATALGNAVKHIQKEQQDIPATWSGMQNYLAICANDNERLLKEIKPSMADKTRDAYPL